MYNFWLSKRFGKVYQETTGNPAYVQYYIARITSEFDIEYKTAFGWGTYEDRLLWLCGSEAKKALKAAT